MTKRYSHLSPAHLSAAVKRLEFVFSNLSQLPENTGKEGSPETEQTRQSSGSIVPTASPEIYALVGDAAQVVLNVGVPNLQILNQQDLAILIAMRQAVWG